MSGSLGSPVLQAALFVGAALFLAWEIWAGWRRGVVRSAIHFGAFVLSGIIGFFAGQAVAILLERFFPGYGVLAGLFVGSILTLGILAVALLLSALLFKRTGQQGSSSLRLFFGIGGAVFGLLTGLFLLWGAISIVRATGALADAATAERPASELPAPTRLLVRLRDSLELGPAGKVVESVDIVPGETYDLITGIGRLTNDPDAMMRFLDYPGVQKIMQHPKMAALFADPDVIDAAEHRDFLRLAANPKLAAVATDPELAGLLTQLDLQKALDYALPAAQSSPTPAP
ncbi:MAG: CvpA family protein [Terrimicrobiaceae bacterium]|nr:CvpA family protein [Terrimicrobiaceae bacterium]